MNNIKFRNKQLLILLAIFLLIALAAASTSFMQNAAMGKSCDTYNEKCIIKIENLYEESYYNFESGFSGVANSTIQGWRTPKQSWN